MCVWVCVLLYFTFSCVYLISPSSMKYANIGIQWHKLVADSILHYIVCVHLVLQYETSFKCYVIFLSLKGSVPFFSEPNRHRHRWCHIMHSNSTKSQQENGKITQFNFYPRYKNQVQLLINVNGYSDGWVNINSASQNCCAIFNQTVLTLFWLKQDKTLTV